MKILTNTKRLEISNQLYQCRTHLHVLMHRIHEMEDTNCDRFLLSKMMDEVADLSDQLSKVEEYFKTE